MIELSLESLDITVAGLRSSQPDGKPCLCLHGWMDNAASFIPLQAALPELNIFALDSPGHGRSDHFSAGQQYHLLDQVAYVLATADALGWQEFNLIGHSLGGCVAPFVAVAAPERVRNLIMLEALGPLTEPAEELPARLRRASLAMNKNKDRLKRIYTSIDDAVDARMAVTKMDRQSARLIVERNLRSIDGGFAWGYDGRLRAPSSYYMTEEQVLAVLNSVTQQTLVVLAEEGYLLKREATEGRLNALKQSVVVEVDGHHHMHMDDPEPSAAAIRTFFLHN